MYHAAPSRLCLNMDRMGAVSDTDSPSAPHDGVHDDDSGPTSRGEQAADAFERWRGGDRRAMDGLVRVMTPVLWHIVRAYGLGRGQAEDVIQTVWVTLVQRHASIYEPRAVSGWLTTSARREAWRVLRQSRRATPVETEDLDSLGEPVASAEYVAIQGDRDRNLWRAVAALDERCRRLLHVIAFQERPDYAALAEQLGMPVGSIGPTRGRCLTKLRATLTDEGGRA